MSSRSSTIQISSNAMKCSVAIEIAISLPKSVMAAISKLSSVPAIIFQSQKPPHTSLIFLKAFVISLKIMSSIETLKLRTSFFTIRSPKLQILVSPSSQSKILKTSTSDPPSICLQKVFFKIFMGPKQMSGPLGSSSSNYYMGKRHFLTAVLKTILEGKSKFRFRTQA